MAWSKATATSSTDDAGTFTVTVPFLEDGAPAADLTVELTRDRVLTVKWLPGEGVAPLVGFQAWSG